MNKKLLTAGGLVLTFFAVWIIVGIFTPQRELIYQEISLKKIKGLQDCQMLAIEVDDSKIYVVRCPNSDVSLHWSEGSQNSFVHTIDKSSYIYQSKGTL